jgi:undecaprenyldiphospho-muramoylpentapeptide beta-N-acetylglucosaminyltransferase
MRVVISAGGTGGHIYPALAIINKIKEKEPNSEFLYIGTHNRMEKDIVPKEGIPFKSTEVYGLNRRQLWKNFKVLYCLYKARKECSKWIKDFKPDIVIGVGGYVTVPVLSAAHKLKIKTFLHEQNSVPGKANLSLASHTDLIGVSFKSSMDSFPANKTIFTGNPCSEDAVKKPPMEKVELGLDPNKKLILIVMGSLGASTVNDVVKETLPKIVNKPYQVLYVTGKNDYDEISKMEFPDNVKVVPYIDGMTRIMKRTDLMVTRAGASTLSEIIALQIPSILIPSPFVPNNHQFKNAEDLVKTNAASLIEEKNLNSETLIKEIDNILTSTVKQNEMKENLSKLGVPDSATIIYDNIQKLIERKR